MEIQSKGGLAPTPTTIITTTNTTFLSANQSHQVHTTQDTLSPITKLIHVIPPQTAATTASHSFAQAFLVVWVLVALLAFFFNCIQITAILLKAKRSRRKKLKGWLNPLIFMYWFTPAEAKYLQESILKNRTLDPLEKPGTS